jgi:hypothetical protein
LLPVLSILCFSTLLLLYKIRNNVAMRASLVALTILLLGDPLLHQSAYSENPSQAFRSIFHPEESLRYVAEARGKVIADFIKTSTLPADRIFIWGFYPQLYAMSDRLPATRFVLCQHIVGVDLSPDKNKMPEETRQFIDRMKNIAADEFESHLPKLVIDTAPIGFWGWQDYPITTVGRIGSLVQEKYIKIKQFWGIDVYRLNTDTSR